LQVPLTGLRAPVSGAFDNAKLWHGAELLVDQALADAGLVNDGTVERRVVQASPADALFEAAATADLVVVGTRGSGGFAGRRLGSVSNHVLTHANATVVVVPTTGRRPPGR
jgi:nucleotide-binding universal stress UspA family protein